MAVHIRLSISKRPSRKASRPSVRRGCTVSAIHLWPSNSSRPPRPLVSFPGTDGCPVNGRLLRAHRYRANTRGCCGPDVVVCVCACVCADAAGAQHLRCLCDDETQSWRFGLRMLGTCRRSVPSQTARQPKHITVCYEHALLPEPFVSGRLLGRGRYRSVPAGTIAGRVGRSVLESLSIQSQLTGRCWRYQATLYRACTHTPSFPLVLPQIPVEHSTASINTISALERETSHPTDHNGSTAHAVHRPKLHVPCRPVAAVA